MNYPSARWVIVLATLFLASCGFSDHGFLAPAGPIAEAQRNHFLSITAWTLVVIVPLFVATPIVLWKYRFGKKDSTYRPNWTFSWILEGLIWGLPLIIVGVLGWNVWKVSHQLDPYTPIASDKPTLRIQVVGLDWKWLFIYPDQKIASVNQLVFPADRPVRFELTSETVMQAFMIPRLGSQIYAMPGMITQLNLLASEPGSYRGQNTQYNGKAFAKQKFTAKAVSEFTFEDWVNQQKSNPPLDISAYNKLARRSVLSEPVFFGNITPGMFQRIIERVKSTPAVELPGAVKQTSEGGS